MIKILHYITRQNPTGRGVKKNLSKARKINASTPYDTCGEPLSPFGGLLALIKSLDLFKFEQILDCQYQTPTREPEQGHNFMLTGLLMLLFIGFNRIWHPID